MSLPLNDQIACVRRELALRRNVYPRMIASKSMTQAWADYQISAMEAVLATLEAVHDQQGPAQEALFGKEPHHATQHET